MQCEVESTFKVRSMQARTVVASALVRKRLRRTWCPYISPLYSNTASRLPRLVILLQKRPGCQLLPLSESCMFSRRCTCLNHPLQLQGGVCICVFGQHCGFDHKRRKVSLHAAIALLFSSSGPFTYLTSECFSTASRRRDNNIATSVAGTCATHATRTRVIARMSRPKRT